MLACIVSTVKSCCQVSKFACIASTVTSCCHAKFFLYIFSNFVKPLLVIVRFNFVLLQCQRLDIVLLSTRQR